MRCPLCAVQKDDNCPLCHGSGRKVNHIYLESNERYTPRKFIILARNVMESIDLDPASCEEANLIVQATKYYDRDDDGLSKPWHGNVFCNPPYSRIKNKGASHQELFIRKTYREYSDGNIYQAILLLHGNVIMNDYFEVLWQFPICIVRGTIYFRKPGGGDAHDGYGNVIIYMGDNNHLFMREFSKVGTIIRRVNC